jgi:hypothetical protein
MLNIIAPLALLLPIAASASPAIAQIAEPDLPVLSVPGTPPNSQPRSPVPNWSLADIVPSVLAPPNLTVQPTPINIIVLPGVSQAEIDRVLASTVAAPAAGISVQNQPVQNQPVSTTCRYSPSPGSPNLLGENALVTVTEFADNTIFRYQSLDKRDRVSDRNSVDSSAYPNTERLLILYDTPLSEARRQLANSRDRYAQFLGLGANTALVRQGFGPINRSLACGEVESTRLHISD